MKVIIGLLTATLLTGCGVEEMGYDSESANTSFGSPSSSGGTAAASGENYRYLELINEARREGYYCGGTYYPPTGDLYWNDDLSAAAYGHSRDMVRYDFVGHTGSDGLSVGDRVTAEGYAWRRVGENVAAGYRSAESVVEGWLASEGHCRNLMNPEFRDVGMAEAQTDEPEMHFYGSYWTQVFAAPR